MAKLNILSKSKSMKIVYKLLLMVAVLTLLLADQFYLYIETELQTIELAENELIGLDYITALRQVFAGQVHDVNILDEFLPEAGAFYVMDRGYVDFRRLFVFTLCSAFFVLRTKKNVLLQRRYSHPVDRSTGLRSDHTVILTPFNSAQVYPDPLRRVSYFDAETTSD